MTIILLMLASRMAKNVVSARLDIYCFDHTFWVLDCGNVTTDGATPTSSSNCQTNCFGNNNEFCGGPNSLSLYWNGRARQPDPTFVQTVGVGPLAWNFEGCFR